MIKITKTVIEVSPTQFYDEIKRLCMEFKKYAPNRFAANFAMFKRELGLKMTELQFLNMCEECGISIKRSAVYFDQFDKKENT